MDKREIEALVKEAETAINARYATVAGTLDTHGLVVLVSERTVEAMQGLGTVKHRHRRNARQPVAERADRGRSVIGMVGQAGEDTAFKFAAAGPAGRHQWRDE
jgi:hypothetical protein